MFNGKKLATQRKLCGLSQEQLAKKLNVSLSSIAMYETNKRQPDNNTIIKMSNLFNVSVDYLLDNDNTSRIIDKVSNNDEEFNAKLKQLAEDEFDKTLFKKYGDLTDEQKKLIMSVINGIIDEASREIK